MVEALCSTPVLEPISIEELVEIGISLDKQKQNPDQALKILKVLDKKLVTSQLLIDSKIGKRLSAVDESSQTASTDIILEIKEFKDKLKKRWTEVYKRTK